MMVKHSMVGMFLALVRNALVVSFNSVNVVPFQLSVGLRPCLPLCGAGGHRAQGHRRQRAALLC